jgi:hypothetical protein
MEMLFPLLNTKSDLSVTKRVLLYKQLIRLLFNFECPVRRCAAHKHVRRLKLLQS